MKNTTNDAGENHAAATGHSVYFARYAATCTDVCDWVAITEDTVLDGPLGYAHPYRSNVITKGGPISVADCDIHEAGHCRPDPNDPSTCRGDWSGPSAANISTPVTA